MITIVPYRRQGLPRVPPGETPDGGRRGRSRRTAAAVLAILAMMASSGNPAGRAAEAAATVSSVWAPVLRTDNRPPGLPPDVTFSDVSFIDERTGWVVGAGSDGSGVVLRTTDGGATWTKLALPANYQPWRASFTADSHGHVLGTEPGDPVLNTADGGNTWTEVLPVPAPGTVWCPPPPQACEYAFKDVFFTDANNGHIAEAKGVLNTTDGGRTWTPGIINQADPTRDLESLSFSDASNGLLISQSGNRIYATTDGGRTWNREFDGNPGFADSDPGPAAIVFKDGGGHAVRASGAGLAGEIMTRSAVGSSSAAWSKLPAPAAVHGVDFASAPGCPPTRPACHGFAVGAAGADGSFTILGTTDGGMNWRPGKVAGTGAPLQAVSFPSFNSAWAVGAGSTILKLLPLEVTGVTPARGHISGGSRVTITGTGFSGALSVGFGAGIVACSAVQTAAPCWVISDTEISAVTPAAVSPGTVNVVVTTPAGISGSSPASQFAYFAVTVGQIVGRSGPLAGGTPVTIKGEGFASVTAPGAVRFGDVPAGAYEVKSDSEIETLSPPGRRPGPVAVTVATLSGASEPSADAMFTYLEPLPFDPENDPIEGAGGGDGGRAAAGAAGGPPPGPEGTISASASAGSLDATGKGLAGTAVPPPAGPGGGAALSSAPGQGGAVVHAPSTPAVTPVAGAAEAAKHREEAAPARRHLMVAQLLIGAAGLLAWGAGSRATLACAGRNPRPAFRWAC